MKMCVAQGMGHTHSLFLLIFLLGSEVRFSRVLSQYKPGGQPLPRAGFLKDGEYQ